MQGTNATGSIAALAGICVPVRALGNAAAAIRTSSRRCAGRLVSKGAPLNPHPAKIINLSALKCAWARIVAAAHFPIRVADVGLPVLWQAAGGNSTGPVEEPGNCPNVLAAGRGGMKATRLAKQKLRQPGRHQRTGRQLRQRNRHLPVSFYTTSNDGQFTPHRHLYRSANEITVGNYCHAISRAAGVAGLMWRVGASAATPIQLMTRLKNGKAICA
ncbi:MAG: hypothetical protein U1F55_06125 [Chitinivorax sp.]